MRPLAAIVLLCLAAGPVDAAPPCPDTTTGRVAATRAAERCRPASPPVPFDPSRIEQGSRPGFVRISPDTELRIDGRVRAEYGVRR